MKLIKYLSIAICSFMLFITNAYAASYTVSVTSSSVTVGNSITLTINGSDLAGKFILTSSNNNIASLSETSIWLDNNSKSITINTSNAGTATITIKPEDVTGYDGNGVTGDKSVTITVKEKQTNTNPSPNNSYVPPKKSSNNNLSSLTIDGYSLDKEFNKDTLEYSVTVSRNTSKININAQKADSTATTSGTGEKEVKVGLNSFEIKVTAQNGDVKTYKINVTVLEPLYVEVDNKKYTIVENETLDLIEGYQKTTIKINENDILAYYNELTKLHLVVLKDEEGNSNYYIYDNNNYSLYKEYNFSGVRLYLLKGRKPENYIEREFTINDETIKAYQLDNTKKNTTYALEEDTISNYYLIYAMNVKTGNKNYYLIDKLENTAIRYDEELNNLFLDVKKDEDNNYKNYFFITLGALGIVIILFGISLILNGKSNKKKYK